MVRVLVGVRGCVPRPTRHSLVTLFFLSVSVKDRPLHWVLGKSQTYWACSLVGAGAGLGWLVLVFCERKTLLAGWFGLAETNKRTG